MEPQEDRVHQTVTLDPKVTASPYVLALREELREGRMKRLGRFGLGDLQAEVCRGRDAVWCIIRREGRGGLALRTAHVGSADYTVRKIAAQPGEALRLEIESILGRHELCFSSTEAELHRMRAQV